VSLEDRVEFNEGNEEPRQALVILVDTSSSMQDDIPDVNQGLVALQQALQTHELACKRVEVAIVAFGGSVRRMNDFTEAATFQAPELFASGTTPMGSAILTGLSMIEGRKAIYRSRGVAQYRPWIFLITDGAPTDKEEWPKAVAQLREAEAAKKVVFFAVGTSSANFDLLQQITSPQRPPKNIREGKWREMFEWLSVSMQKQAESNVDEQPPLPKTNDWTTG
jgi:uncharacterized protein YegL